MKRLFLNAAFLFSLPAAHFAQPPEEKLSSWSEKNPIEKVYLHLDRDEYIAGQTIWFKAYLVADFLPADKSTVLFAELLNASSVVLMRQTLPVVRAVSQGQFGLPDSLSEGKYVIRAYTATMLNHDPDFVYKRSITITGKQNKNTTPGTPTEKKIRLEFFPEGGNFVAGLPNTIAFKATDADGWPVNAKGLLKNNRHEILAEFATAHDGMGMFDLDAPLIEGDYYVELKDDPEKQRYPLPKPAEKGIVFRLLNATDGIHFEIFQHKDDPVFQAAYMIGQMQHHPVFKQPLKQGLHSLSGVINTSNLSSGILHITVFNKDGMPLAERLAFVNNKEYIRKAELVTDTVRFSPRSNNHFTLSFKDSVTGSFSVAVTDPAFQAASRAENIFSRFLLSADLKGYVHNPAWYFSADNDTVRAALDLLLMTHGWRRFKWEQLIKKPIPENKYKDPAFATISGRVTLEGTKKPFADKEMLMLIISADSTRATQLIRTDATGFFKSDSILFFGKARILLSDIRGRKSKFVDLQPGDDSLNRYYQLPALTFEDRLPGKMSLISNAAKLADEYNNTIRAEGKILSEVVIKTRKKTALEELEEKYASGAFSGDSRKTFDLLHSDDAHTFQDIFEYLQARVPGLIAGRNQDGDYYAYFRQQATISSMGNQGMDIFLDEVLTDINAVGMIPPSQIAMVKVYSQFVGSTGGGAGGAIAIYLKKGADYFNALPSAGEMINYNGFSVIKEFYSPDYSVHAKKEDAPDHRITLHWKPDIFVNGKDIKVPLKFYNNDRATSFKVVVEGMTTDGKMLLLEKIIAPNAY